MKGIHVGGLRLPLVPLNDEEISTLQQALQLHEKGITIS